MCQTICITLYTQACNNSFPYFVRVVRQVVVCMDNRYVCFGKNHIMRNRNNCIHVRITRLQCCAVLNEGHFATPTDPYSTFEDKTTLLRPDFQNWFHAATRVWVPPRIELVCQRASWWTWCAPAWSCPSQGKPKMHPVTEVWDNGLRCMCHIRCKCWIYPFVEEEPYINWNTKERLMGSFPSLKWRHRMTKWFTCTFS